MGVSCYVHGVLVYLNSPWPDLHSTLVVHAAIQSASRCKPLSN